MYGIQTPESHGLRSISLGPRGLYASPAWGRQLEVSTLKGILDRITGLRTRKFAWNVRFDHKPLAAGLASLGLGFQRTSTHVLPLDRNYEHVFAGYHATLRNHVRKARRRGVVVREARNLEDVFAYYQVHTRRAQEKGGYAFIYPVELLTELIRIRPAVWILIAECEDRVVAGGVFCQDGCSVMYWHGAYDRDYSRFYPFCAVLDEAIRRACDTGAAFFNLGGSAGLVTLESFKASWGAHRELNWMFEWTNPLWSRLSRLKAAIQKAP